MIYQIFLADRARLLRAVGPGTSSGAQVGGSGTWTDHEETDCEGIRVIDLPFFSIYAMMTDQPGLWACLPGRMTVGKQWRSFMRVYINK